MKRLLFLLLGVVLGSCMNPGPPGLDIEPPVVVGFSPEGQDVDPETLLTVWFSEPMDDALVDDPLVFVLAYEDADEDFFKDADRPPLASKRQKLLVPCAIESSPSADRVLLSPEHKLDAGKAYLVVVSAAVKDLAGNPLVLDPYLDDKGVMVGLGGHVLHYFRTRPGGQDPDDDPVDDPVDDPDDKPSGDARVVLSEVMANPSGTESHGEYLELVNLGPSSVDLAAWLIGDKGQAGQGDMIGPCMESSETVLEPKSVGLLVGESFVIPEGLPGDVLVVCTDRNSLTPRGLKNDKGEVLVLSDDKGVEVDRYGGWLSMKRDGCSATRVDLEAEDSEDNWLLGDEDPCSTPGRVPGFPP